MQTDICQTIPLQEGLIDFFKNSFGFNKQENKNALNQFQTLIEQELMGKDLLQQLQTLAECWSYTPLGCIEYMQKTELAIANTLLDQILVKTEKIDWTELDAKIFSLVQEDGNAQMLWEKVNNLQNINQIKSSTQENLNLPN